MGLRPLGPDGWARMAPKSGNCPEVGGRLGLGWGLPVACRLLPRVFGEI